MRLIGTVPNESHAQRFSLYLSELRIEHRCERAPDGGTYQIWVADEDRLAEATEELERFCQNPLDLRYPASVAPEKKEVKERVQRSPLTIFLLALCSLVYLLNALQERQMPEEQRITPIQQALLFETSEWPGLYNLAVLKIKGEEAPEEQGPLFAQIREGEIWRLFSPCILHLNFLHLLFNMLWLWVLGRPIEARIGCFRLLFLTLVIGVATNTAQYLMSGPLFLGFSGVVMGWAGLIWAREKVAPWEGYPVQRSTIWFLTIFIFAMLGLQLISFFLTLFSSLAIPIAIANTAHIGGLVLGAIFGHLRFFARRVR